MAQLIPGLKSYFRPESLEEFQRLIQAHGEYKLLAGGTSLAFGLFKAKTVIDISGLPLSHIRQTETGDLEIGSCATIYDLESSDASKHYSGGVIISACDRLASTPLRNLITVGGNIMGGFGWSDLPVLFLVLDAEIIAYNGVERRHPIAIDHRHDRSQLLRRGELLTHVILPANRRKARSAFIKTGKTQVDFSIVTTAAAFYSRDGIMEEPRIAVGGITAQPQRLPEVESLIAGQPPSRELFIKAGKLAVTSITLRPDSRAGADYRLNLLKVQLGRTLEQAWKGAAS